MQCAFLNGAGYPIAATTMLALLDAKEHAERQRDEAVQVLWEAVERAIDQCDEAAQLLRSLKRGDCWCEAGIGNPMMTNHSPQCRNAKRWLDKNRCNTCGDAEPCQD